MATTSLYKKNKYVAAIICFLFGVIGIHQWYLGHPIKALFYAIFSWTGIPLILAIKDFIVFLVISEERFDKKYNAN